MKRLSREGVIEVRGDGFFSDLDDPTHHLGSLVPKEELSTHAEAALVGDVLTGDGFHQLSVMHPEGLFGGNDELPFIARLHSEDPLLESENGFSSSADDFKWAVRGGCVELFTACEANTIMHFDAPVLANSKTIGALVATRFATHVIPLSVVCLFAGFAPGGPVLKRARVEAGPS